MLALYVVGMCAVLLLIGSLPLPNAALGAIFFVLAVLITYELQRRAQT